MPPPPLQKLPCPFLWPSLPPTVSLIICSFHVHTFSAFSAPFFFFGYSALFCSSLFHGIRMMHLIKFAMPICKVKQLGSGVIQAFLRGVNNYNNPGLYISYSCYSFAKQISLTVGQCQGRISIRLEQGVASGLGNQTSHCYCSYRSTACSLLILYSHLQTIPLEGLRSGSIVTKSPLC